MENHHSSPTNNANISKENLISANHINDLPIISVLSNNNNNNGDQIKSDEEVEAYINSFPPGFRFYPTDEELVTHYLKRKLDNLPLHPNKIHEINIYKYNPETIAAHVKPTTEEKVWYILTPRDRKYKNGNRPSRSAGDGYWKATGADKKIRDHKKKIIGSKKALVFYIGKAPKGEKTNWIMHEYKVSNNITKSAHQRDPNDWELDKWVLCKIYKNSDRDNSVFTQRRRSGGECCKDMDDEVVDTTYDNDDRQVHRESSIDENFNSHDQLPLVNTLSENSTGHDLITNNMPTTFTPHQVPGTFSNFPQSSYMATTFCNNMPWSTSTRASYEYQSFVPHQFSNGGGASDRSFHYQCAPLPISSIGQDHTMKSEGFDISDSYTGQDYCVGHEILECDRMDCVDQYLVNNYEMSNSIMYLPKYNTSNLVNGE